MHSVAVVLRTGRQRWPSLARGLTSAADDALKAWEARARKEAKGQDPYTTFGSQNQDVRRADDRSLPTILIPCSITECVGCCRA